MRMRCLYLSFGMWLRYNFVETRGNNHHMTKSKVSGQVLTTEIGTI